MKGEWREEQRQRRRAKIEIVWERLLFANVCAVARTKYYLFIYGPPIFGFSCVCPNGRSWVLFNYYITGNLRPWAFKLGLSQGFRFGWRNIFFASNSEFKQLQQKLEWLGTLRILTSLWHNPWSATLVDPGFLSNFKFWQMVSCRRRTFYNARHSDIKFLFQHDLRKFVQENGTVRLFRLMELEIGLFEYTPHFSLHIPDLVGEAPPL